MTPRQRKAILHHIERMAETRTRARALSYLSRYGSLAVDLLIEACRNPRAEVRFSAAWELGKYMRERRAFEAILALIDDPDDRVRYDSMLALGHLGDPRAIEPLIKGITADESGSAGWALSLMGPVVTERMVDLLESDDIREARTAIYVIAAVEPVQARELLAPCFEHPNPAIREAVEDAFYEWPEGTVVSGIAATRN